MPILFYFETSNLVILSKHCKVYQGFNCFKYFWSARFCSFGLGDLFWAISLFHFYLHLQLLVILEKSFHLTLVVALVAVRRSSTSRKLPCVIFFGLSWPFWIQISSSDCLNAKNGSSSMPSSLSSTEKPALWKQFWLVGLAISFQVSTGIFIVSIIEITGRGLSLLVESINIWITRFQYFRFNEQIFWL